MSRAKENIVIHSPIKDIGVLVKFKLSLMVSFSSLASFFIFSTEHLSVLNGILLLCGGLLVTFAANALNQALEGDFDKLMERTKNRPVAEGRMTVSMAVLISGVLCSLGVIFLAAIHPLAATLGMLSFVLYAFVYTPLKRYSTLAVPVGAIPGALPILIGGVAAQGTITIESFCLFALQYLWQFPHFWAIAWLGHQDYTRAGFKLIKDIDGNPDPKFGLYSAVYALLSIVFVIPGIIYGDNSVLISFLLIATMAGYAWYSWKLYENNDRLSARSLMFYSFFYLPVILSLYIINTI